MRRITIALVALPATIVPAAYAAATVPPGNSGGVAIVRQQAETAATEYFATAVTGGATHVACETPTADTPGVVFYCFGVNSDGAALVAQATINDYGSAEISAIGSGPAATTAPTTTTSPIVGSAQGSGSQVVQVDPILGPTIVSVTHDGAGAFAVQPQQGGVPAGRPLASVTGAWSGRYLVGLGGTISGFAITADGDWTLTVEQPSSALALDAAAGVSGQNADVVAYSNTEAWPVTVSYDGTGPIVVASTTVSGVQELVNQAGPFTADVEVPAGPGFITIEAPGAWSLRPPAPTSSTTTTTTSPADCRVRRTTFWSRRRAGFWQRFPRPERFGPAGTLAGRSGL